VFDSPEAAVAAAAEWLDGFKPGWHHEINAQRTIFAVSSPCHCVGAIVFSGGTSEGYTRLLLALHGDTALQSDHFTSKKESGGDFYAFASPEATMLWLGEVDARVAAAG
jgi:hypothetical protein